MAKYDIKFSCGHTEMRVLLGPVSDRQKRLSYFEEFGLCSNCYKNKIIETRKIAQQKAIDESIKLELPILEGSEKQVLWANQLRLNCIHQYDIIKNKKYIIEDIDNIEDLFIELINMTSAKFFIDNKYDTLPELLEKIKNEKNKYITELEKYREAKEEIEKNKKLLELQKEAEKEATIFADTNNSDFAKIEIKGNIINVFYKYDVLFIEIVKRLGYTYDGNWKLEAAGEMYGNITDRAVELGVNLLEKNFNVCCLDLNIKEKIEKKDFIERQYKWLILNNKRLKLVDYRYYKKTLLNIYKKGQLPGRWENRGIIVKVEHYKQLLDFCKKNKFSITSSAYNFIKNFAGEENMKTIEELKKDLCED